jgi:hypothetical protein
MSGLASNATGTTTPTGTQTTESNTHHNTNPSGNQPPQSYDGKEPKDLQNTTHPTPNSTSPTPPTNKSRPLGPFFNPSAIPKLRGPNAKVLVAVGWNVEDTDEDEDGDIGENITVTQLKDLPTSLQQTERIQKMQARIKERPRR